MQCIIVTKSSAYLAGMLASANTVRAVTEALQRQAKDCPMVLDPVCSYEVCSTADNLMY